MILVGDDWDPILKIVTFKVFLEYKDIFTWTYKDLKGIPLKLCIHQTPLVSKACHLWKRLYRMNKNYVSKVQEGNREDA